VILAAVNAPQPGIANSVGVRTRTRKVMRRSRASIVLLSGLAR
jgi:hypothetical protein